MAVSIPAPLAAAFETTATISSAELGKLLPIDDATLRRHVRAGNIGFVRLGFGASAPRRFTLESVMAFLEDRSERECQSTSQPKVRTTPTTSGGEGGGILALLAKRSVEKQRRRSAG